jgi:hypothetical protein
MVSGMFDHFYFVFFGLCSVDAAVLRDNGAWFCGLDVFGGARFDSGFC